MQIIKVEERRQPSYELAPTTPYYKDETSPLQISLEQPIEYKTEGSYRMISMNAQTLMLIANGAYRLQGAYGRKPLMASGQVGLCFRCHGDHWI